VCPARHNTTATAAAAAVANDDDCMSMTSREVAAILSTAGPLAPPSDDDNNYDDDDVSELKEERHGGLPSAMQLLRVHSSSSDSSTNTSAGTPVGRATPVGNRNMQLTPFQSQSDAARLNNSWSGGRADQFRPYLNGVCDREDRLDVAQRNGDLRTTVGSLGGSRQHMALYDLLRTHRLLVSTLEVQLNNGHHIRGPPFQVSSREVIKLLGQ